MTILETPKEKPKRDMSRAFDIWLSKYPTIEPFKYGEEEWLFGQMNKNGKKVSLFNFVIMPENLADSYVFGCEWVRETDVDTFLQSVSEADYFGLPLVHLLYFPYSDTLLFQTIWKQGVKTEIRFEEKKNNLRGIAKVYLTNPKTIEGSND